MPPLRRLSKEEDSTDMLKHLTIAAALSLSLGGAAMASGSEAHVEDIAFSFEGPFGTFDQMQLQRGLQVYTEVCAACHGLHYVPLRTLGDAGGPQLPEDQVRAYAAFYEVWDPTLSDGEGDTRTALPTDNFPGSALPGAPDLSLMAKSRAGFHGPYGTGLNQLFKGMGGPEHIASILTSFTGETKEEAGTVYYENPAFSTGWIAMPPPLAGDDVEFADGHSTSLEHEAQDVAAFLMWAAEPKMMARKQAGLRGVFVLLLLSVLLYLTNKRLWAPIKGRKNGAAAD